ncbi:HAL/PAL/TAL family ammonia-lyase [Rathayibacter tanaceti]|uniref:Histidine ammonia-lyase n=2 Tax=Rathayibacter tanaceti TaxID=1671680 RepID=A0ACD2XI10_9MICO|nr:aromatic amino acid ammonia-lyase [Rathayibacter tanaceti]KZX21576.1 Histidine ammonia-lyase [Rathayibacter tanaceti]TCO36224.1 histidine ammonia-lyase [Rathayibacter tanaceti]
MHSGTTVTLGTATTSLEAVVAVAQGAHVELDPDALERVARTQAMIANVLASGRPVYGLTTGVGDLYTVGVETQRVADVQLGMLRSHASGVGEAHDETAVRAVMTVMITALARGFSGVGVRLLQTMVDMLNRGVTPWAPAQGSVGYLTATAHIGLAVFGEGRAWFDGELLPGAEALRRAGIERIEPGPREGHALISGTYEITGVGALAVHAARRLVDVADAAGALSLEVLRGNSRGYDPRLQALRPHPGQVETAHRLRALLASSEILAAHRTHRLQDALSLRCIPQVHGAVRDALTEVERVIGVEIDSVTDNPVFVVEDEELVALPGGNGHGAPTALALDYLAIAVAELSTMSQARSDRLTNHHYSELPAFLMAGTSAASGFMIPPYAAAALAGENRGLAAPATVHTVSTSAGQEDHVSMGTTAALKARRATANAQTIVAIELLCAAQAVEFHAPLRPGAGTGAVYDAVRSRVGHRTSDTEIAPDIEAVRSLVADGTLHGIITTTVKDDPHA